MRRLVQLLAAIALSSIFVSCAMAEDLTMKLKVLTTIDQGDSVVMKFTDSRWPKMCTTGYLLLIDTSSDEGEIGCWWLNRPMDSIQVARFEDGIWSNYFIENASQLFQ